MATTKGSSGNPTKQLDHYFQNETAARRFSGAVHIARKGEVLLQKGYGFADHDRAVPNQPSTIYTIGSMTKAFVTMCIFILQERKALNIDDKVHRFIPEFPEGDRVTLHQIMRHCSGLWCYLQDFESPFWEVMDEYHTTDKLLQYISNRPFDFPPGTQYKYSNSGYVLLGLVIERVSGETFGSFLKKNILEPLGMHDTLFDPHEVILQDRKAVGYDHVREDPPPIAKKLHVSVTYTTGGILSTVRDMYLWDQALYENKLVSKKSMNQIFSPCFDNYACGWWVDRLTIHEKSYNNIWHWGCSSGFHSIFIRLIDEGVTIILLQNTTSPDLLVPESPDALFRLRDGVASILFQ